MASGLRAIVMKPTVMLGNCESVSRDHMAVSFSSWPFRSRYTEKTLEKSRRFSASCEVLSLRNDSSDGDRRATVRPGLFSHNVGLAWPGYILEKHTQSTCMCIRVYTGAHVCTHMCKHATAHLLHHIRPSSHTLMHMLQTHTSTHTYKHIFSCTHVHTCSHTHIIRDIFLHLPPKKWHPELPNIIL